MKIKLFLSLVSLSCLIACKAQQDTTVTSNKLPEVWYTYTMNGGLLKGTFKKDQIVYQQADREPSEKTTQVFKIVKELGNNTFIVHNARKRMSYAIMQLHPKVSEGVLEVIPVKQAATEAELQQWYQKNNIPSYSSLLTQQWFSNQRIEQLKTAPGLDQLKAEDLLTSLQWRKDIATKLEAFLKDNKGNQFAVYRLVEQYRNRKLVTLGYNPFKRVVYNFHKQFKDHPEIIKLLEEEISF